MLTREWVLVKEEGEVLRQRQATINATRITAVAGKDKNKPSWRLLAVEKTLITMFMLMLWILFSFKTWIITVLFSPVSGSSMDTVALIDLSNSSLITSSSRRASSRFSSSLASFSRFSFVKTLSIVSILESFFRPKISVLFFREASIKSWVQLLSEGAMLV